MNKLKVKKVQVQMLSDRGYTIPSSEKWILTADVTDVKIIKKYKNMEYNNFYTQTNTNTILYVYYITEKKIKKDLQQFVDDMVNYDRGIIIGTTSESLELKKNKEILEDIPFKSVQAFLYEDLTYNVTHSIKYDKHELIDKSLIIPQFVDMNQLSIIQLEDPVVKYFGWQLGDVIKITRKYDDINILTATDIGYRVVSNHLYLL